MARGGTNTLASTLLAQRHNKRMAAPFRVALGPEPQAGQTLPADGKMRTPPAARLHANRFAFEFPPEETLHQAKSRRLCQVCLGQAGRRLSACTSSQE